MAAFWMRIRPLPAQSVSSSSDGERLLWSATDMPEPHPHESWSFYSVFTAWFECIALERIERPTALVFTWGWENDPLRESLVTLSGFA